MEQLVKWLYTVCLLPFIFVVIYLVAQNNAKKLRLPPSPGWSIPFIGHFYFLTKLPIHRTLQGLSAKYGPVFGLKLGNQYAVVVSSPAAVEECFGINDIVLANRIPNTLAGKHIHYDSTGMATANYNDHWRNLRRISNQEAFSITRQNMYLSLRQDDIKSMIKSLFQFVLTPQGMQKVEIKPRLVEMTLNIIVGIVTGKRYYGAGVQDSKQGKKFHEIVSKGFELTVTPNPRDFIPFLRWIGYRGNKKKMLELKTRIDALLQSLINESKTKIRDTGVAQSLLHKMLLLQEADSGTISDETIKGLLLVLVAAGTDPIADEVEWAMSALLNEPEKLLKAQREIDVTIGPGRLVEECDLSKLPYLQAIYYETLRMYPTAPVLIPHYSSADCTIQGFFVPRGTIIIANVLAIHRDPEVWEDPLSFKPERVENADESSRRLYTFGIGRRSCPGASMARNVVMLALASLIQCFDWERIGEEKVDMQECDRLTMYKRTPLEAKCQPRSNMMNVLSSL